MTQGDFVKINNPKDGESALPFLMKRIQEWDYTVPLCIKLEKYDDGRSLSQNALFHVWCSELSKEFIKKSTYRNQRKYEADAKAKIFRYL